MLKNPSPCFDGLSMSGTPPRFHCTFPLTLSPSKGERRVFQHPASVLFPKFAAYLGEASAALARRPTQEYRNIWLYSEEANAARGAEGRRDMQRISATGH
jgi:hypothetical protein